MTYDEYSAMMKRRAQLRALIFILSATVLTGLAIAAIMFLPLTSPSFAVDMLIMTTDIQPEVSDGETEILAAECAASYFDVSVSEKPEKHFRDASVELLVNYLDTDALCEGLADEMSERITGYIEDGMSYAEIYDGNDDFLPDITRRAYDETIQTRLEHYDDYCREKTVVIRLQYEDREWLVLNHDELEELTDVSGGLSSAYAEAVNKLEYIDFGFSLEDWTSPAPEPDRELFGETTDPQVISDLLETPAARHLINGQTLDFDPNELLEGRSIHYYLDDSILVLVWQQDEHGAVGTFSEVFLADATQLRRKIADDTFGCMRYFVPTELSRQSNAVAALSGDFYDHYDRCYGIYAYDRKVMRSCLTDGQTCFFTGTGDMLFTYEDQFATEEEAQSYMDEHDAVFSVSFGPVMIENGVDVTPENYPLGEVLDTYARCAIGQLGRLHYLGMTINCESPDHYVYVTLRQAADSMIAHGCINAYTLDGGQTGSIIINNELINPVQFGYEREMSDIIYFASAVQND